MTVETLPRLQRKNDFRTCENGCRAKRSAKDDAGFSPASHVLWILGRKVYVCGRCARSMAAAYEQARLGFPEQQEAAA